MQQCLMADYPLAVCPAGSWADGGVVLLGDAVHPMMPNLGQGGSQARAGMHGLTFATLKHVPIFFWTCFDEVFCRSIVNTMSA